MKPMINHAIQDKFVYQKGIKEGKVRGKVEVMRKSLLFNKENRLT